MTFKHLGYALVALALGASPALSGTPKRIPVAQGGTNLGSGTSGGVLGFTAAGVIASSSALTVNLPVIGGGAGALPSVGSRSGNTTEFATISGALVNGHCPQIDASGNLVDSGAVCATGTGSGTVTAGLINQLAWYSSAGTAVVGLTTANNGVLVTSAGGVPSISITLPSGLTIPGATLSNPVISGTASGAATIPVAMLVSDVTTVNGQACALAGSCTIVAQAGTITVGTTHVASGTPSDLLYDNGGVLGNLAPSALSIAFSQLTSLPTTLSGYGITNGLSTSLANTNILVGNGSGNAALRACDPGQTLVEVACLVERTPGSDCSLSHLNLPPVVILLLRVTC